MPTGRLALRTYEAGVSGERAVDDTSASPYEDPKLVRRRTADVEQVLRDCIA